MKKLDLLKVKKLVALTLLGSTLTLTGCGEKDYTADATETTIVEINNADEEDTAKSSLLQGTLLDGTVVANIDGDIMIVRPIYHHNGSMNKNIYGHTDYYNISNNVVYTENKCLKNYRDTTMYPYTDANVLCEITDKLTEEEIKKAVHDKLTEDDVVSIVFRINQEEEAKKLELKK